MIILYYTIYCIFCILSIIDDYSYFHFRQLWPRHGGPALVRLGTDEWLGMARAACRRKDLYFEDLPLSSLINKYYSNNLTYLLNHMFFTF